MSWSSALTRRARRSEDLYLLSVDDSIRKFEQVASLSGNELSDQKLQVTVLEIWPDARLASTLILRMTPSSRRV